MIFRLALAVSALVAASPLSAAQRNYSITDFKKVRVDGPYRVTLVTGTAPYARASGAQAAIDSVSIEVLGETVVVRKSPSSWGGFPGDNPGPVEIVLGTHDLTDAWLNGSGALSISAVKGQSFDLSVQGAGTASVGQLSVDTLQVGLTGTGSANVSGRAAAATIIVRGTGSVDATALTTKDAVIGAEGSAVVKLTATNTAKVDTQGTSSVEIGGRPACTVRASGSAVVSGCR